MNFSATVITDLLNEANIERQANRYKCFKCNDFTLKANDNKANAYCFRCHSSGEAGYSVKNLTNELVNYGLLPSSYIINTEHDSKSIEDLIIDNLKYSHLPNKLDTCGNEIKDKNGFPIKDKYKETEFKQLKDYYSYTFLDKEDCSVVNIKERYGIHAIYKAKYLIKNSDKNQYKLLAKLKNKKGEYYLKSTGQSSSINGFSCDKYIMIYGYENFNMYEHLIFVEGEKDAKNLNKLVNNDGICAISLANYRERDIRLLLSRSNHSTISCIMDNDYKGDRNKHEIWEGSKLLIHRKNRKDKIVYRLNTINLEYINDNSFVQEKADVSDLIDAIGSEHVVNKITNDINNVISKTNNEFVLQYIKCNSVLKSNKINYYIPKNTLVNGNRKFMMHKVSLNYDKSSLASVKNVLKNVYRCNVSDYDIEYSIPEYQDSSFRLKLISAYNRAKSLDNNKITLIRQVANVCFKEERERSIFVNSFIQFAGRFVDYMNNTPMDERRELNFTCCLYSKKHGTGKSTLVKKLIGDFVGFENYTTDINLNFTGQDANKNKKRLVENFGGEVAEGYALGKNNVKELKSHLLSNSFEYKPRLYKDEKIASTYCAFLLTSNDKNIVADTENRRFSFVELINRFDFTDFDLELMWGELLLYASKLNAVELSLKHGWDNVKNQENIHSINKDCNGDDVLEDFASLTLDNNAVSRFARGVMNLHNVKSVLVPILIRQTEIYQITELSRLNGNKNSLWRSLKKQSVKSRVRANGRLIDGIKAYIKYSLEDEEMLNSTFYGIDNTECDLVKSKILYLKSYCSHDGSSNNNKLTIESSAETRHIVDMELLKIQKDMEDSRVQSVSEEKVVLVNKKEEDDSKPVEMVDTPKQEIVEDKFKVNKKITIFSDLDDDVQEHYIDIVKSFPDCDKDKELFIFKEERITYNKLSDLLEKKERHYINRILALASAYYCYLLEIVDT